MRARTPARAANPRVPGQLVLLTWRWPSTVGSVTGVPLGHRVPPAEVRRTEASGSPPAEDSRQAATWANDSRWAALGATLSYVPIIDTPTVPVLKPPACAPMTARPVPPARPSQTVPKRSTSRL